MKQKNKNNLSKVSVPGGTIYYVTEPEFVGSLPKEFPDVSKMMKEAQNQPKLSTDDCKKKQN